MIRRLVKLVALLFLLGAIALAVYAYFQTRSDIEGAMARISINENTRRVLILIDGVSYQKIQTLRAAGHFKFFQEPSRVIVPFPVITNVALAHMWRASREHGYESLYFDRANNRMGGGALTYLKKPAQPAGYHALLDYEEPKPFEFSTFFFPKRIGQADVERGIRKFAALDKPAARLFFKSTDAISHSQPDEVVDRSLFLLERFVDDLYRQRQGQIEISMLSDHGNNTHRSRRSNLDSALEAYGYTIDTSRRGPDSVVMPGFGLVTFGALYAEPSRKSAIAKVLAPVPGVDFVCYRQDGKVLLHSARGSAVIESSGRGLRYTSQGDPLALDPTLARMRTEGKADAAGWAASAAWFETTARHHYPDAVFRLHQAFNDLVENDADILVSLQDGYFYGSRFFENFVTLHRTHGNLTDSNSYAFFMSTARRLPPYIRSADMYPHLKLFLD